MRSIKKKRSQLWIICFLLIVTLYGCGKANPIDGNNKKLQSDNVEMDQVEPYNQTDPIEKDKLILDNEETKEAPSSDNEEGKEAVPLPETTPEPENMNSSFTVVIDAGHQRKGNSEKEPIGPGALELKPKVSSGTQGVATDVPEYVVNLDVSLKLQKILEEKGYRVVMIRETHEVNISNSERAEIANTEKADAFVRIHCNGSDNPNMTGALTMCQTKGNPYCGDLYEESYALSKYVINELCNATGAKNVGIIETDEMSGINWCKVPVTIVEMGYMTNGPEDTLLCDDEYQDKLAQGIAAGIERYLQDK